MIVTGPSVVHVDLWKSRTRYHGFTHKDWRLEKWYWEYVESLSESKRAKLLVFVTGSSRPFVNEKTIMTITLTPDQTRLPSAHTCVFTLVLPRYSSFEVLRVMFDKALDETEGFGLV